MRRTRISVSNTDLFLMKVALTGAGITLGFGLWAWAIWSFRVSMAVSDMAREALR